MCGVYKITNIKNGKIYVGSSKNIKNRWKQHITKLNNGSHGNLHLQNAWNKYGAINFKFDVIEECEPSVQFEREQFYLNLLNPFEDNGYNIVRQISKEYMSDHFIEKSCSRCGNLFHTFCNLSKYCDDCKDQMKQESKETWDDIKTFYVSQRKEEEHLNKMICDIYGSMEYYWECNS